jgi:cystathionine beta-lyase family protein involved in aluminum resistance
MKLSQLQVQHLYWRAGFLSSYDQIQKSIGETPKELFEQLVGFSTSYKKITIKNAYQIDYKQLKMASNEEKKAMRKMSPKDFRLKASSASSKRY